MVRYWKTFAVMILKLAVPALVVFGIKIVCPVDGLLGVVVYGALYVVLYFIDAYFIVMNEYEKGIVNKFAGKVLRY